MLCPLPLLKTQLQLKELSAGERIEVICNDPGALNDIPAWCKLNGHLLLITEQNNREIRLVIEKDTAI